MICEKKDIFSIWRRLMTPGNFEDAWKLNDEHMNVRGSTYHLPRHFQSIWNGSSLKGKHVLIRCYHGLGDTIQFIRYTSLLKNIASRVIVWAQPELIKLLQSIPSIDEVLPLHDGTPDVQYDADIEVMELPYYFRSTPDTIPADVPYLHTEAMPVYTNENELKVGLVWKAGNWDQNRNIPFIFLEPLFKIEHIKIFILQDNAESAGWTQGYGVNPGTFELSDYARFINSLDLMISVDSMPVHLAGALGIEVWNLLCKQSDWRWMTGNKSPWYPTMKIFRQDETDNWNLVIEEVVKALKQKTNSMLSSDKFLYQ